MIVQHSSTGDEWYTPLYVVKPARVVLGDVDLDPASDEHANKRIKARRFLSEKGLETSWLGYRTLFINPPGGKVRGLSQTVLFWQKLMDHRSEGELDHAVFVAFSISSLQTSQLVDEPSMCDFPFCVPARRLQFEKRGPDGFYAPGGASHANAVVYVPGRVDASEKFAACFETLGRVVNV